MRKLYILCAILMLAQSAFAQVKETSSWRFGFTGGVHASELRISDLNKDLYPTHKALFSGIPVYFQKSFGPEFNFAIRPEIAYLSRGGSLEDIMRNRVGYYQDKDLNNLTYKVNAHYLDVRLPIMYRFGTTTSTVRPYIYVAPILGVATGGNISSESIYASARPSELYKLDASKANLNPLYFSGAVGLGFDWLFNVADTPCRLASRPCTSTDSPTHMATTQKSSCLLLSPTSLNTHRAQDRDDSAEWS